MIHSSADHPEMTSAACTEKLAEIQEDLFDLKQEDFPEIKRKMKEVGIFSSKSELKSAFTFIFATATKRPRDFELYAKLCVDLFIETQFSVKGFDLKEYASTYLFTQMQTEKDIYRLTALSQFVWSIKAVGGFTSYHVASIIKAYVEKHLLGFIAQMHIFCLFAEDIERYYPKLFVSLHDLFDMASKNHALPPVLEAFHSSFDYLHEVGYDPTDAFIDALCRDDFDVFQQLCTNPFFDPHMHSPYSILFTPKLPKTLFECAAYLGATKCFKYLSLIIKPFNVDLNTLGMCAVAGGSLEIVRLCIQYGSPVTSMVKVAAEFHRIQILQWMLLYQQSEIVIGEAFSIAAAADDIHVMQALYQYGQCFYGTPLHSAARHSALNAIDFLTGAGISADSFDSCGMSALHCAVLSKSKKCVRKILKYTSDFEAVDYTGYTAKDIAHFNGLDEIEHIIEEYPHLEEEVVLCQQKRTERSFTTSFMQIAYLLASTLSLYAGDVRAKTAVCREIVQYPEFFSAIFVPPTFDSRVFHSPSMRNNNNNNPNNN